MEEEKAANAMDRARGSVLQLMTTEQLAEELGLSKGTLENWRYNGTGPAYISAGRNRGGVWYRLRDVEAWLDSCTVVPMETA